MAALFLPLGAVAVLWAVLAYRSQRRFMRRARRSTGVVQRINVEKWGRRTNYAPLINFTTAAGVAVTGTPKTYRNGGYEVGQQIKVLYDPDDPHVLEIDARWSRWFVVAIAVFFALVLLAIGVMSLFANHPAGGASLQG